MNIRNFCIIAHIDHGKSTLADRFLELTKTVEKRKMHEQYLDTMELERERGITIKLQPVKMSYESGGQKYILNLIDTPGHVDFSYEVSRSLAAVEGAILLVDASKGVQAQTLANLHLAQQQGLKIIPVLNKIDLPNARTEQVKEELSYLLAVEPEDILEVSAKNGTNVEKVLERIIKIVPPPKISDSANLKALIFDSTFDAYKGVIAYIRVFEGSIKKGDKISAFAAKAKADVLEAGYFSPNLIASDGGMSSGEIGYIATGLKDPGQIRVGDTITNYHLPISNFQSLPGYKEPRPMVFASFFPENNDDYDILKDALGKLKLTDASLVYEPESSAGLGRGFRLGFLGMLHVEIISERLKREFGLSLIISSPSVEYAVKMQNGEEFKIRSASMLPDFSGIKEISEPIVYLEVLTPTLYMGSVMELISTLRNVYKGTDYLGKETALLKYEMPLSEVITDFYDKLKSVSSGYASMSYEPKNMQEGDLVRLDILIAKDLVEPFSRIVPKEKAYQEGRAMVTKLKEVVPPQMFEVSIQAAIGGKVIAAESIRAKRKDVTQHMYGGDITRRMKLWKKQKRGKERMKETGRVNLPQDVFLKMLKR
ncbi:MAG: elongation factor 4 [Candidatus Yanofskybacteria bacterium RIFCSPLOWO2_02_FULL_43_10]|nr:MAG: elongation factor 4 [Candidatus Yanofskybacteria bacterium RIFCSPHIGHO2_01_FULL_43_32]OGN17427.1 MAG: elongation factor 4 [Candidatus Yanofskybacteria bacterium RIFCSPHIGHO2_12_FULL_43_11]OGN24879.1 MAG: elongation factor 4 [Candidatus Yanofskybacteria bacterium RIFCSPLOWO2_01_FULL_43_46]OGN29589.1 MAG: elongation factor 4 [Candidatus Yanofskybacteria bacterium RIFCSPLOWO2_02_FULL_43_10]